MSADRFLRKRASLGTILPMAVGPTFGGIAGRAIGARYKAPDLGAALGAMTGGIGGGLIKEQVEEAQRSPAMPPGAPYALDASSADIPSWALQGAQLLQPAMKQAGHFGPIVGGDMAGLRWPIAEGLHNKKPAGSIARDVAGQGLGTLGGGVAGHLVGGVLDKTLGGGKPINVPGINVSLSDLLAGLGATIGNVKGTEFVRR